MTSRIHNSIHDGVNRSWPFTTRLRGRQMLGAGGHRVFLGQLGPEKDFKPVAQRRTDRRAGSEERNLDAEWTHVMVDTNIQFASTFRYRATGELRLSVMSSADLANEWIREPITLGFGASASTHTINLRVAYARYLRDTTIIGDAVLAPDQNLISVLKCTRLSPSCTAPSSRRAIAPSSDRRKFRPSKRTPSPVPASAKRPAWPGNGS